MENNRQKKSITIDYSKGKIYKIEPIVEHDEGDIYIGSTTKQYLSQRMNFHKSDYKKWKNGTRKGMRSFNLFEKYGFENCGIFLIEDVNCNSKNELVAREGHYIRSMKCLNKIVPDRTHIESMKQYYENNKQKILENQSRYNQQNKQMIAEKSKKYRSNHKTSLLEKNKEYRMNHKDEIAKQHKQYYEENKDIISQKAREYYDRNKESILEKQRQKYTCICGSTCAQYDKQRHFRSNKHQTYLQTLMNL